MDLSEAFVAADGGRWFIVINEDHQSLGNDGDAYQGLSNRIIGSANGYNTYHDGVQALRELRGEG